MTPELQTPHTDADFIRALAEMLETAPRYSTDFGEGVILIDEEVASVIVEGLRCVFKRSLAH